MVSVVIMEIFLFVAMVVLGLFGVLLLALLCAIPVWIVWQVVKIFLLDKD